MEDLIREWKWCESKEQRTCDEVCRNNLRLGKCIPIADGCKVKPNGMSAEDIARLRTYSPKRDPHGRPSRRKMPTPILCEKLKKFGVKKAAAKLYQEGPDGTVLRDFTEGTVRAWIKRGRVPVEYRAVVQKL